MPTTPLFHIAFYRFVRIADTAGTAALVRELTRDVQGSVLIAGEGINGVLAGEAAALDDVEAALRGDPRLNGLFACLTFRRTACRTPPFQRMKVHERAEILPLGVASVDAVGKPGTQLDPGQWRTLLADDDLVLIDNRSRFEYRLGHFKNAIDPQVDNFRDLPRFIEANAPRWKAQQRRIAMYCTGGIRCEKTAAWMQQDMGLTVHQLQGGILRYLAETSGETPDETSDTQREWQGECFVFDNRIALDASLQETSTRAEDVYADNADEQWRLRRARRLAGHTADTP